MSIRTIATVAVARNLRPPTKQDAGVRTKESQDANKQATALDLLAKSVPITLVSSYTAFTSAVNEIVMDQSRPPGSPQYLDWRWAAFVALVLLSMGLTWKAYQDRVHMVKPIPWPEMFAVGVASAGWGLALPESPLLAQIEDKSEGLIAIAFIVLVAGGINLFLSNLMTNQRRVVPAT